MFSNMNSDMRTLLTSILIASLVVGFIIYLIISASYFKIFKKSGKEGYKAFIPIYNVYVLMQIVDMQGWMILLYFVPLVNLFAMALLSVKVANTFNKGAGFAIGILFFPYIFYPLLALSQNDEIVENVKEDVSFKEPVEDAILCPKCGTTLAKDATSCFVCHEPIEMKEEHLTSQNYSFVKDSDMFEVDEPTDTYTSVKEDKNVSLDIPEKTPSYSSHYTKENSKDDFTDNKGEEEYDIKDLHLEKKDLFVNDPTMNFSSEDKIKPEIREKETPVIQNQRLKNSTKTLDDILRMNSGLYAEKKSDTNEKSESKEEVTSEVEVEELLKMIEEAEEAEPPIQKKQITDILEETEPKKQEDTKLKTCPSCGSTIPRYSQKCLLCGTQVH